MVMTPRFTTTISFFYFFLTTRAFVLLPTTTTTTTGTWRRRGVSSSTARFSGNGIATDYTWHEEAFEIEVSVKVPKATRAKEVQFKATPKSISLKLVPDNDSNDEVLLMDPERELRGKVSLEGTYWVISDAKNDDDNDHRLVTVTIEKQIRTPKDGFDVIDYDWKGVYQQEEEGEVSFRKYDEAEELDVREYAATLGVDVDNINMSMVDKTMFSSGMNITKSSYDSLQEAGLMKEVTQQGDGTEWAADEDGDRIPFSSMGKGVSPQELQESSSSSSSSNSAKNRVAKIPFLDTDSPWHNAVPVDKNNKKNINKTMTTAAATASTNMQPKDNNDETQQKKKRHAQKQALQKQREAQAVDPIGTLTVARLKAVLQSRGLKVSGNKKELQDRLRAEVNAMVSETSTTTSTTTTSSSGDVEETLSL